MALWSPHAQDCLLHLWDWYIVKAVLLMGLQDKPLHFRPLLLFCFSLGTHVDCHTGVDWQLHTSQSTTIKAVQCIRQ